MVPAPTLLGPPPLIEVESLVATGALPTANRSSRIQTSPPYRADVIDGGHDAAPTLAM
jgi:hypothetical protein